MRPCVLSSRKCARLRSCPLESECQLKDIGMVERGGVLEEGESTLCRRRKHVVSRTTSLRIETHLYVRWCAFKTRMTFPNNSAVAEYLLNLADSYDQEPVARYDGALSRYLILYDHVLVAIDIYITHVFVSCA